MRSNPYTPGAGFMPAYMAGRDDLIERAEERLANIQRCYPQRSVIYYGLRGVGKTVLLNRIEMAADNMGILYRHIEASESGKFTSLLLGGVSRFLSSISAKENAKDFVRRCFDLVKSFKFTYNIEDQSVDFSLNSDILPSTGIYSDDLTEIFVELGKAARKSGDAICLFIDEIQYLSEEEISGLIVALHRCNQLRLPVMIFGAGLPKVLKVVGEACSYTERLFRFEIVDKLTKDASVDAIVQPATDYGVEYDSEALKQILKSTDCYPYFIQEMCSIVWEKVDSNKITGPDILESEDDFFQRLDEGFFAVRYNRCSNAEKAFMTAMVKCEKLPCTISNVARILGKSVKSISPLRGRLIAKGMIYPTGHAEINFTVPEFDRFIRRINPNLDLKLG